MRTSTCLVHLIAITFFTAIGITASPQNAVPLLINYQGELRSPTTGEPVPDGSYEMLFRIYDAESGGTRLWQGAHSTLNGNPVQVTDGIFHAILGSGEGNVLDTSIFNAADRWLEIRVGLETLTPRQKITSVAYSIAAEDSRLLGGKEVSDFAAASHPHSGDEITSGAVSEARIDPTITRDSELDADIAAHTAVAAAHHTKTTSFAELTDAASDAQIPGAIARDSEIMPTALANDGAGSGLDADKLDGAESAALEESAEIDSDIAAHTAVAAAHHTRYTDTEAVAAMGPKSNTNPLNHDKTMSFSELTGAANDSQIPAAIARDSEIMPTVLANDGTGSTLDADRIDGVESATLEESAEIDSDIAAHAGNASAHHTKYTDAEAVAAMGAKADSNPLNHDKTTSLPWGSITAIPVGFADNVDNDTTYSAGDGLDLTGTAFSAEFGGSGSATTVSRSDHDHDAAYVNEAQADSVTSAMITDGEVANADVNAAAAIAGTKISPDFGSQNIVTTGRIGIGTTSPTASLHVSTNPGANSVILNQGDVITNDTSGSTSRYVVSIGGTWYWGVGKTNTGNNHFHIINYPNSRWDLTVRSDTGNVGVGTTSPQEKLDVNGNARVAGDLTVVGTATLGGVTMGKIYLTTSGTILSTDGGTRVLSWDATNSEIELTNTSGDWLDYWWQAQKGATTSGNSGATATGTSNVAIISGTNNNDYGFEIHFGQADAQGGWCSVWLQYANGALVGHYIKY